MVARLGSVGSIVSNCSFTREIAMTAEWKEYTGSGDQIAEMQGAKKGFILRSSDGMYSDHIFWDDDDFSCIDTFNVTDYLICNPHPLVDMIKRWADTGQPVYCKQRIDIEHEHTFQYFTQTERLNWDIPNTEYSFTPFED